MAKNDKQKMKDEFPSFDTDALYARAAELVVHAKENWNTPLVGPVKEGFSDSALVDELSLYAQNDSGFYRKWATPIIKNLQKKANAGKFDTNASLKSWERAANAAADMYAKEFGGKGAKGKDMFPVSVRKLVAKDFAADYEEEIFDGVEQ